MLLCMMTTKPHTVSIHYAVPWALPLTKRSTAARREVEQLDRHPYSSGETTATVFSSDQFGAAPQQTWLIELSIPLRPTSLSRLYLAVIYILIVVRPDDCRFLPRSKMQCRKRLRDWGDDEEKENSTDSDGALRERLVQYNRSKSDNKRRTRSEGPLLKILKKNQWHQVVTS